MTATLATFGRRVLAWVVIAAVALLAIKLLTGLVVGFVMTVFTLVALVAAALAVIWAVRRL